MELTVQGKQIDVGDALRTHVTDKIEDLNQKYFNHATFATVTFSKEGHGHARTKAHISIQVGKNIMVNADAVEADPYVSFESAADKVGKQLRRYKRKLRDHHARLEETPESEMQKARSYVLAAEQNDEPAVDDLTGVPKGDDPVVIAEMTTHIETLTVSEAVMRMDLAAKPALLFRNASNSKLNMVYRRTDGNVGWVDPENQA
jgi:ribosomal subunit interface protein